MQITQETIHRLMTSLRAGQIADVIQETEHLIKKHPGIAGLYEILGLAHAYAKNFSRAELCFKRALKLNPRLTQTHVNLGNIYLESGSYHRAVNSYRAALSQNSTLGVAKFNLALAQFKSGQIERAKEMFLVLIADGVKVADSEFYLGLIARNQNDNLTAVERFKRASLINPDHFDALFNLGNVLRDLFQSEESLVAYKAAYALNPRHIPTLINKSLVCLQLQNTQSAMSYLNEALSIEPENSDAGLTRSLVCFLEGQLKLGFEYAEQRFRGSDPITLLYEGREREWQGKALPKDTVLVVHAEQGLGDTIMMVRFLDLLDIDRENCVILVQDELLLLLDASFKDWQFDSVRKHKLGWSGKQVDQRVRISLMSLPHVLQNKWDEPPGSLRYIQTTDASIKKWKAFLPQGSRKLVGLVWRGNPNHWNDVNRSVSVEDIASDLPSDTTYVILQKDITDAERTWLTKESGLSVLLPEIGDFTDTAALCCQLDLVVTVDTSVAHLAAAISVPTIILLPFLPDWRWQLSGQNSAWYPSMILLRQSAAGDWGKPLQQMVGHIETM